VAVSLEQLTRAHVAAPDAVVAAAAPVADWLAGVPPGVVVEALAATGDPVAALHALTRLRDHPGEYQGSPPSGTRLGPLLRMLGAGPALANAIFAEGEAWPALLDDVLEGPPRNPLTHAAALAAAGATGPIPRDDLQRVLRRHRRRELARIGGRDLLGLTTLEETVREISVLAEGTIETALACARARLAAERGIVDAPFVVLGMGKLGGGELNFSSDVDLVYVYDAPREPEASGRNAREFFERLGVEVTRALSEVTGDGFCFRVDLRLRPGGDQAPVATSLAGVLAYYETWGQTWERAAWLKARAVAGDRAFGARVLEHLEPFVYRRYLDYGTLEDLKAMKRKVDSSLTRPTARERDVKLGRGGIRGVEFYVQAHQLVHGGKDARLRLRGTLDALAALGRWGYVDAGLAERLAAAYRFLRHVEHKLQIVDQRQTQLIPVDAAQVEALARRLGYVGPAVAGEFWTDHAAHTGVVDGAFAHLFHGAEEARERETRGDLRELIEGLEHEEQVMWRLVQLGFRDADTAYADLCALRDGPRHAPASPRRRRAIADLAPALLTAVTESADPDRALHYMVSFVANVGARTSYLHLLLENPAVLRLLVRLFATSEFLSRFFLGHPELLDSLVRADLVQVERTRYDLAAALEARMEGAGDLESELDTIRRFRHEEFLRIGVHDIEGELDAARVQAQLSTLADVCLGEALALARRQLRATGALPERVGGGLAVLALGKLGASELNYHSDLDLIFVYDAGDPATWAGVAPHELFTRLAQRAMNALQTTTREGIAYRIDTRLRPSGNQGPLVSSLEAFEHYHRTSAALWERQALIKARVVAGPAGLRTRLDAVVAECVYRRGLEPAEVLELARMRERIAGERGGRGDAVNIKTDRGGIVDVEFAVQMLQLRHGHVVPGARARSTRAALDGLVGAGVLDAADAEALRTGYDFLRTLESRMRIERDQPVEALGDDLAVLTPLGRRLGLAGSDEEVAATLRSEQVWHRNAVRAAYEHVFEAAAAERAGELPWSKPSG
jgi:glutamate-ammonia-ligase adenylyltransferase